MKKRFQGTFEDTKEVFRSRSLWELSKGLNIFYEKGPLLLCISYHSVMKLSRVKTRFFSLWNYETSVAQTSDSSNTFWQSLGVRANIVLLYVNIEEKYGYRRLPKTDSVTKTYGGNMPISLKQRQKCHSVHLVWWALVD